MTTILGLLLEDNRVDYSQIMRIHFEHVPFAVDDEEVLVVSRYVAGIELGSLEGQGRWLSLDRDLELTVVEAAGRRREEDAILDIDHFADRAIRLVPEDDRKPFLATPEVNEFLHALTHVLTGDRLRHNLAGCSPTTFAGRRAFMSQFVVVMLLSAISSYSSRSHD